jgi:hypothetical protein
LLFPSRRGDPVFFLRNSTSDCYCSRTIDVEIQQELQQVSDQSSFEVGSSALLLVLFPPFFLYFLLKTLNASVSLIRVFVSHAASSNNGSKILHENRVTEPKRIFG